MLCKRTSNIRLNMTKRPTLHNSKKQIMYTFYSRKQVIKAVKFHLQNFVGLARTLLKKYYQRTKIWYAKLALTRRRCFIAWERVNSHPTNHQLTFKSSHRNTKPIPKWVLVTNICMQERGSMIMNSHFLRSRTIMRHHPFHKKVRYSLIFQRRNWGTHQESHTSVPQKLPLKQTKSAT